MVTAVLMGTASVVNDDLTDSRDHAGEGRESWLAYVCRFSPPIINIYQLFISSIFISFSYENKKDKIKKTRVSNSQVCTGSD